MHRNGNEDEYIQGKKYLFAPFKTASYHLK